MSGDYLLLRKPGPWPQWTKRVAVLFASEGHDAIGRPEALMAQISTLFPGLRWTQTSDAGIGKVLALVRNSGIDPSAPVWIGRGGPELQLSADTDGQVKSIMVSRASAAQIRLLRRPLGLVSFNLQADGVLGMLFG